jgi:lipoprotein-releasing system ATP-binding protein
MTLILKAADLHKSYYTPHPLPVLKGISLEVKEGESIAIMGNSGEGKSTLLHILGGLEPSCQGTLSLLGGIGFIFQSFNLLDDYTLLQNVLMPARIARQETRRESPSYLRALSLLEEVGLMERRDFLAKHLSGGEKQRAAIARALLNEPKLILADEPSGNLDYANSLAVHQILLKSVRTHQKALIVVTHNRELAALCDTILTLKEGKIHWPI